ncbi:uncharacterized protein [Montipora foliosa]|uniref:uncharacterized protein n=1 Tax=Montipora foliosa TaxID=591990 RepID=UPI0035F1256D
MSISPFRQLIFSLCQELSAEDLDSMKYLLRDLLTTREIEGVSRPSDLFVFLEQRGELGSENCGLLKDIFVTIQRRDLLKKLEDFDNKQLGENERIQRDGSTRNAGSPRYRSVNKEDNNDYTTYGGHASSVSSQNNDYVNPGHEVMLREVSADIFERLGFLLNPSSSKNWIYLAGKLDYTYKQAMNYKLYPMQSTQMLLGDWSTREDATVVKLYQTLKDIGRADAAKELEPILVPAGSTVV